MERRGRLRKVVEDCRGIYIYTRWYYFTAYTPDARPSHRYKNKHHHERKKKKLLKPDARRTYTAQTH